jgi:hypothetical protein
VSRLELISKLASLSEDDPRLREVEAALNGEARPEPRETWYGLKAVAAQVGKHPVWLHKLRVPEVCGERLAGRRAYRVSRVLDYLRSEQCRARVVELAAERKRRDAGRKGNAA